MSTITDLVGEGQIAAFERDGAIVVRGIIEPWRIKPMYVAIAVAMADTGAAASTARGFYNGFFHWRRNPAFREFILESRLGALAAHILRAASVNFFYDQLIVKEPGLPDETPWHLDSTYFPTRGGKVLSIWVPFDHASPSSGAVTYVKGSHRWIAERGRGATEAWIATLPPPGSAIPGEDMLAWTLEPGDVLVHDVNTLHGAPANLTSGRRRALATRWTDQDVRYDPRPDDFLHLGRKSGLLIPDVELAAGDALTCSLFPQVWPRG